jgi:hypothetical protein
MVLTARSERTSIDFDTHHSMEDASNSRWDKIRGTGGL